MRKAEDDVPKLHRLLRRIRIAGKYNISRRRVRPQRFRVGVFWTDENELGDRHRLLASPCNSDEVIKSLFGDIAARHRKPDRVANLVGDVEVMRFHDIRREKTIGMVLEEPLGFL